jgi:hypothetical protein
LGTGSRSTPSVLADDSGLYLVVGRNHFLSGLLLMLLRLLHQAVPRSGFQVARFPLILLLVRSLFYQLAAVDRAGLSLLCLFDACLLDVGHDVTSHNAVNHLN